MENRCSARKVTVSDQSLPAETNDPDQAGQSLEHIGDDPGSEAWIPRHSPASPLGSSTNDDDTVLQPELLDEATSNVYVPASLQERFVIQEDPIGGGGEATVYLAHPIGKPGHRFALKVYKPNSPFDRQIREKLLKSAYWRYAPRLLEYDVVHVDANLEVGWEAMEYFPLGNFEKLMSSMPSGEAVSLDRLRALLVELVDALSFWEEEIGLRQVDFSPTNILVRDNGDPPELVIADFGGLKGTGRSRMYTAAIMAKLAYMAPEANAGEQVAESPYWGLGVIFYQLLTGAIGLFGDAKPRTQRRNIILGGDPDVSAVADLEWRHLVAGLLTKDPGLRLGSAGVREWLSIGSKVKVRDNYYRDSSFTFLGRDHTKPDRLAKHLASEWDQAVANILDPTSLDELETLLQQHEPSPDLNRALRSCRDRRLSDDRILAALITELALVTELSSDHVPTFRGYGVGPMHLSELARKALLPGEKAALEVVDRLRESRALISYSSLPACRDYARLDDQWRRNYAALAEALNGLGAVDPDVLRRLRPEPFDAAGLLLILTSPEDLSELGNEAREANSPKALSRDWYRRLVDRPTTPELEPAQLLLKVKAARFATKERDDLEKIAANLSLDPYFGRRVLTGRMNGDAGYTNLRSYFAKLELDYLVTALDQLPIDNENALDESLARLISHISPTIPATYRGRDITETGLRALVTEATTSPGTVKLLCALADTAILSIYSSTDRPDCGRLGQIGSAWTQDLGLFEEIDPTPEQRRSATVSLLRAQIDPAYRDQLGASAAIAANDPLANECAWFSRFASSSENQLADQVTLIVLLESALNQARAARANAEAKATQLRRQEQERRQQEDEDRRIARTEARRRRWAVMYGPVRALFAWLLIPALAILISWGIIDWAVTTVHHSRQKTAQVKAAVLAAEAAVERAARSGKVDCYVQLVGATEHFPCSAVPLTPTSQPFADYLTAVTLQGVSAKEARQHGVTMSCEGNFGHYGTSNDGASPAQGDLSASVDSPTLSGGTLEPTICRVFDDHTLRVIRNIYIKMTLDPQHQFH
jgi:hypothetical protein